MLVVAVTLAALAGCGSSSSGPSPDKVTAAAGAVLCDNSGYYIIYRASGEKRTIYDCEMQSGKTLCVTYEGGLASDATDQVRLVFASALGSGKPDCLKG